jgi:hypothetical protein
MRRAAALITPHLPHSIRRVPGLLDRFGAVRLTPVDIGIDSIRAVRWSDVLEVQTYPLRDAIATTVATSIDRQVGRLILPIPGMKFATRSVTSGVADLIDAAIAAILLAAVQDQRGDAQVPCLIVYRRHWKTESLSPGLVSSAVLCLPWVAASILATAQQHQIRITANPSVVPPERMQKLVEKF